MNPNRLPMPVLLLASCALPAGERWRPMLDPGSRDLWTITDYGGQGEVVFGAGHLILGAGSPLTGVTWRGPLPGERYEIELRVTRLEGDDFFLGLTFPVRGKTLTLVLGGFGGTICGLSCLDGLDASENESRFLSAFETGRPYAVRLSVEPDRIRVWIDGRLRVDQRLEGRELSVRAEVRPSRPLGLCSYATRARVEGLAWRPAGRLE
ncbi:MAG: hypothetical protein Fur0037_14690 [Planctomycetota bacterium]